MQKLTTGILRPQTTEHLSLHGPTAAMVTTLLQLTALDLGTVDHHISEMRTYPTVDSEDNHLDQ